MYKELMNNEMKEEMGDGLTQMKWCMIIWVKD